MTAFGGLLASGLRVELVLHYINTSSSKCLMNIMDRLEEASKAGQKISLTWYVDPENESEQECAEEFKEDVTFPFHIVASSQSNQKTDLIS